MKAYLILENGKTFEGNRIGYSKDTIFEIVFNTSMSGYMESITDPSYAGQGIVFTYPLIGNYGVMLDDAESQKPWVEAVITHELAEVASNFRNQMNLNDYLIANKIPGLQGVNTRLLTRTIRSVGVMKAMISNDIKNLKSKIKQIKNFKIIHPVPIVSNSQIRKYGNGKYKIALIDYGLKQNILKSLLNFNVNVTVYPHDIDAKTILKQNFDGIVLSNGPGDPKDNKVAINTIKELFKHNIPILGICLGHQLTALAVGFDTKKLKYGHRGPNHPVKNLKTNRVYISSQNHGYYIDEKTIKPKIAKVIYRNVNDKTVEGLKYIDKKILTVQFHPEACAGPHDTSFIFKDFIDTIREVKSK